jgi:gluconate kinase
VVVILMGVAGDGAAIIAHTLAAEIGWPVAEWPALHALQAMVARTRGRREHLLVASAPLSAADQDIVRGDLHGVRFVDLTGRRESPDQIVRTVRLEFGL